MKLGAGKVAFMLALVALGLVGSACVDDTQTGVDRNQQRLLRPTASAPTADVPQNGPAETPGFSRNNDPLKYKGKP